MIRCSDEPGSSRPLIKRACGLRSSRRKKRPMRNKSPAIRPRLPCVMRGLRRPKKMTAVCPGTRCSRNAIGIVRHRGSFILDCKEDGSLTPEGRQCLGHLTQEADALTVRKAHARRAVDPDVVSRSAVFNMCWLVPDRGNSEAQPIDNRPCVGAS